MSIHALIPEGGAAGLARFAALRGQRQWTALVEVKTGSNDLLVEQLECYLDIARENGFDALVRYEGLRLGRRLGTEVVPALSRRDLSDPASRTQALAAQLTSTGTMTGGLRIPGAVGALQVTADLRAGKITCSVDVDAPREGRPTTRVNWLVRQLKDAPESLWVEAFAMHARGAGSGDLLGAVRANPAVLLSDPSKELRAFRIARITSAGTKRGSGRGAFIDSLLDAIDGFYEQVVQSLKPWLPAPPRLRGPEEPPASVEPVAPSLVSTSISSQDGPQPVALPTQAVPGSSVESAASPS